MNEPIVAPPLSLFTFLSDATEFFFFSYNSRYAKKVEKKEKNETSWDKPTAKLKRKKKEKDAAVAAADADIRNQKEKWKTQKKKKKKKSQREALFRVDPSGKSK